MSICIHWTAYGQVCKRGKFCADDCNRNAECFVPAISTFERCDNCEQLTCGSYIRIDAKGNCVKCGKPQPMQTQKIPTATAYIELRATTNRGAEISNFASEMLNHVETYTIPQYGDAPNDQIEQWSAEEVVRSIGKRAARFKRNSREGQDALDLLKIAHEACLAYNKLLREDADE